MNAAVVLIILFVLLAVAAAVLMIVAWCKIFRKAGIHPGKFFIPIYGSYLSYKLADAGGLFIATMIVSGVSSVITSIISAVASAGRYYSYEFPVAAVVVLVIELIIIWVLSILYSVKLARAFGKSGGFAAGLIFLYPVFICILGFGSAEYQGSMNSTYRGVTASGTWVCPSCGAENPTNRATCECGYIR